jgi:AraC family transcriptional regulator of adaptative response / DNA-3-methyladenine glycosylase II
LPAGVPGTAAEAATTSATTPPPRRRRAPVTGPACAAARNCHPRRQSAAGPDPAPGLALLNEGILQDQPAAAGRGDGLSARQLQRLFVARLGATPAQLHATRRLLLAKQLLTETRCR